MPVLGILEVNETWGRLGRTLRPSLQNLIFKPCFVSMNQEYREVDLRDWKPCLAVVSGQRVHLRKGQPVLQWGRTGGQGADFSCSSTLGFRHHLTT